MVTTDIIEKADREVLERDIEVYTLATGRLSRVKYPTGSVRTIDRLTSAATVYDEVSEFDLDPVLDKLNALREATISLIDDIDGSTDVVDTLVKTLTRLNFVTDGRFEQDPAESRAPLPRLASVEQLPDLEGNDRRFLELQLERERNHVVAELRRLRRSL